RRDLEIPGQPFPGQLWIGNYSPRLVSVGAIRRNLEVFFQGADSVGNLAELDESIAQVEVDFGNLVFRQLESPVESCNSLGKVRLISLKVKLDAQQILDIGFVRRL